MPQIVISIRFSHQYCEIIICGVKRLFKSKSLSASPTQFVYDHKFLTSVISCVKFITAGSLLFVNEAFVQADILNLNIVFNSKLKLKT